MNVGSRLRTVLIIAAALVLGAAWRYLPSISEPGGKGKPVSALPSGAAAKALHPRTEVASLHLASLDAARSPAAVGRDPWRFRDPAPRKLPPREAEPIPALPPHQPSVSPQPASVPSEPTLEYLGSFGPPDKKVAVLSDGKRAFNALEGEVIDGRFIVERIGYESVEIRRVGVPGGPAERLGLRRR